MTPGNVRKCRPQLQQEGNCWVAVAVYHNHRYAITRPLLIGTVVDVNHLMLLEVILKHATPRELLFGHGRPFFSKPLGKILRLCVVIRKRTTAYRPQTN